MQSLVGNVCFSAPLLVPLGILEFIIMHLLFALYLILKKTAVLTYIFDLSPGMTWEPPVKCLLLSAKCTWLTAGAQLDETPSLSPLARSAPSVLEGSMKSPCQVPKKPGCLDNWSCILWSNDNFLFSAILPSGNLASHPIQLIQSLSFLRDQTLMLFFQRWYQFLRPDIFSLLFVSPSYRGQYPTLQKICAGKLHGSLNLLARVPQVESRKPDCNSSYFPWSKEDCIY